MGGKRRGNQGKDKGKMKVGVEGSKKETVTEKEQAARKETETEKEEQGAIMDTEKQQQKQKEVEEQGARKETETETGEDDLLDRCVFLVRTRNTNFPSQPPTEKSVLRRPLCLQEDFHYIDLRTKFVIPNYFPSLINCVGTGTMLMFDNRQVYILGDIDPFRPRIPHTHNEFNNHIHKHTGSSRTSISNCWKPFVISDSNRKLVNPAVLSNKLYCLGYPCLRPEVYDPHASNSKITSSLSIQTNIFLILLPTISTLLPGCIFYGI
ncbi:uncharacterized protein LOC141600342 [Silene latifolia]|uniref:uncharacterized protein LOC141600342 n=1 Tax=Silene latifolia TaxID=37657 RepID=UPI003D779017